MHCPTPELLLAAQRVLGYLHRTRHLGLFYEADDLPMSGMSDSDWAVKHSTTGFTFQYCKASISWGSRRQQSIALSSCEAEIVAASEACKEGIYLRRFFQELGLQDETPTSLSVDNSAARDLAYNPQHHERMKHVERRHFFIRELVELEHLVVPLVKTDENLSDFFTKVLPPRMFIPLRNKIMNIPHGESDTSD